MNGATTVRCDSGQVPLLPFGVTIRLIDLIVVRGAAAGAINMVENRLARQLGSSRQPIPRVPARNNVGRGVGGPAAPARGALSCARPPHPTPRSTSCFAVRPARGRTACLARGQPRLRSPQAPSQAQLAPPAENLPRVPAGPSSRRLFSAPRRAAPNNALPREIAGHRGQRVLAELAGNRRPAGCQWVYRDGRPCRRGPMGGGGSWARARV